MDSNNNIQNSSGMMNAMPPVMKNEPKSQKKVGPIIGALIIILVLVIAGLYFFGQKLNKENPQIQSTVTDTSDNTAGSIEAKVMYVDNEQTIQTDLDKELQDIDYSF